MQKYQISYVIVLFFIIFSPPYLKADELSDLKTKIDEQQKEINELRYSLDRLKGGGVNGEQMDELKPMFGVNMGIFGDANFTTNSREKAKNSFYLGEVDLYSTGNYGSRMRFLSEIVIEGEDQAFEVDLERVWVEYAFSDLLKLKAGKQHTALGYWNKTYHHGKQLFLTVDRPFFLAFEHDNGVIPVHITGLEFEGSWSYNFAIFKYEFQIGNGPGIDNSHGILVPNNILDDNNSKQIILRITGRPLSVPDLSIGLFGTVFTIDTATRAGVDEKIYGVDIAYGRDRFEVLAEYFRLENSDASGNAFYVQLNYGIIENITPYARIETLDADKDDPYLNSLSYGFDRRQVVAGIKYDIDAARSSIKAQYRYDDTHNGNDYNVFEMQWSFGF